MKDEKIEVRVTKEQKAELEELTERSGLNASSQIRFLIHQEHGRVFGPKPVEIKSRISDASS